MVQTRPVLSFSPNLYTTALTVLRNVPYDLQPN
jgi:hypothetical protein